MRDLSEALDILKQQGWFSMIDERFQAALAAEAGLVMARRVRDLAGNERVVVLQTV